jgi:hypothetical protein
MPTVVPWAGQGARPCDAHTAPPRGQEGAVDGIRPRRGSRPWVWAGINGRAGGVSPLSSRTDRGLTPPARPTRRVSLNPRGEPAYEVSRKGMVPTWPYCRPGGRLRPGISKGILRKEVIQPQVPLRLPCYDLVPITGFIFGACLAAPATSDAPRFGGLTGGVYKAQEHIHRGMLIRDY